MQISVVITCFNLENYINEAIESVLRQDISDEMYEVIVVDDCSTDKSSEIIKKHKKVRYLKTVVNSGVLLSTIYGMKNANGNIISFLDGDDVWRNDKLNEVINSFQNDKSLIFLTHNYQFINKIGKSIKGQENTQNVYLNNTNYNKLVKEGILYKKNYVWLGSAMSIRIKNSILNDFIKWAENLTESKSTYQDWPLAFWIAANCDGNFGYIDKKLFYYRIHSSNYSGDSSTKEKLIRNLTKTFNTSNALNIIATNIKNSEILKITNKNLTKDEMFLNVCKCKDSITFHKIFTYLFNYGKNSSDFFIIIKIIIIKVFGIDIFLFVKRIKSHLFNK